MRNGAAGRRGRSGSDPPDGLRPVDTFLDLFQESCRTRGGSLAKRVAEMIERRPAARRPPARRRQPACTQLPALFGLGVPETEPLLGAFAEFHMRLAWFRHPDARRYPRFYLGNAVAELVGPGDWVPTESMKAGFFILSPHVDYASHHHAADELYLVLAGTARWAKGKRSPGPSDFQEVPPGRFIRHKPWQPHSISTGSQPLLAAWAWLGDIDGGYEWIDE